jgi:hypothetical protein
MKILDIFAGKKLGAISKNLTYLERLRNRLEKSSLVTQAQEPSEFVTRSVMGDKSKFSQGKITKYLS